jgi:hypothetical protein
MHLVVLSYTGGVPSVPHLLIGCLLNGCSLILGGVPSIPSLPHWLLLMSFEDLSNIQNIAGWLTDPYHLCPKTLLYPYLLIQVTIFSTFQDTDQLLSLHLGEWWGYTKHGKTAVSLASMVSSFSFRNRLPPPQTHTAYTYLPFIKV